MTSSNEPGTVQKSGSRKFIWLGIAVVLACLLWTGGWFYAADRMKHHLPALLQAAARSGIVSECGNADIRGYPFRIGLFCDQTRMEIPARQISVAAEGFRSAAQVYRPGHVVSELDGPMTIAGADGLSARLDWQSLRTSSVVGLAGLDSASMESRSVSVNVDSPDLPAKLSVAAESAALHVRKQGPDADIAGSAGRIEVDFGPGLQASSIAYDLTIPGAAAWLSGDALPQSLRGSAMVLRDATVNFTESAALTLSGRINVGPDGLISADLTVRIAGLEEVVAIASGLVPSLAERAAALGPVLAALDTEPGDDAITLPLTLRNGVASMGLLPLGSVPPL